MRDADFDDALWLSLCGYIEASGAFSSLSPAVRMYYATRLVEWEVGNGGFEQALDSAGEYWDEAMAGYRLLDDDASVDLLRRVLAAGHDEDELELLLDAMDAPPWDGVPWRDAERVAYVRAHRDEFRL